MAPKLHRNGTGSSRCAAYRFSAGECQFWRGGLKVNSSSTDAFEVKTKGLPEVDCGCGFDEQLHRKSFNQEAKADGNADPDHRSGRDRLLRVRIGGVLRERVNQDPSSTADSKIELCGHRCSRSAEQLGVKEEEVTNEASFVDDLGADSLDTVELVMALEEEFETEIPDEEAEKITSVQQAIDFVNARQSES